jgi:hypothetical protein
MNRLGRSLLLRLAALVHDGHHGTTCGALPPPRPPHHRRGASRRAAAAIQLHYSSLQALRYHSALRIRVCLPSDPRLYSSSQLTTFPACARRHVVVRGRALPHGRLLLIRHRHRRYPTDSQLGTSLLLRKLRSVQFGSGRQVNNLSVLDVWVRLEFRWCAE